MLKKGYLIIDIMWIYMSVNYIQKIIAMIAGNFAKNYLIIEECILTSCRIGCAVEGVVSENRIRGTSVLHWAYYYLFYVTNLFIFFCI